MDHSSIILHSCGFDSIPSDLTTYEAIKKLQEVGGKDCPVGDVRSIFTIKDDEFSGGTVATLLLNLEKPIKVVKEMISNAYILSPIRGEQRLKRTLVTKLNGKWGAYFIMVSFNTHLLMLMSFNVIKGPS